MLWLVLLNCEVVKWVVLNWLVGEVLLLFIYLLDILLFIYLLDILLFIYLLDILFDPVAY